MTVARDMTIRNTAGTENKQAVALRSDSDRSVYYSIQGYIKTRCTSTLRASVFRKCNIYGTVDFIFGNAAAVFQNCSILAPLTSMALVCYDGGDRNVPWSFDRTQRMAGFEYNKPGQLDRVSCDIRY